MNCDPSELRLYFNEFPRPPPANVIKAAREALREANRYPEDKLVEELKSLMSSYAGLKPENVHATSGGEYAFYELFTRLVRPGDSAILLEPTFTSYEPILKVLGVKVHKLRLEENDYRWILDKDKLFSLMRTEKPRLLVIDDPNNPTASPMLADEDLVREVCSSFGGYLLLDEAYTEYAGYSASKLVPEIDNLVVFRTMSKAFALAGMRVSILLATKQLIESIEGFSPRFELSRPSLAAAVEALSDPSYAFRNADFIKSERERVRRALKSMNGLKAYESFTNFILMRINYPQLIDSLKIRLMRPAFDKQYARLSIGSKLENNCAVSALRDSLNSGK
ncbi:MAG: aminotransferase class I/II-fold pyridoxal phosphate-dependent enzyme [Thermoprotei archaeon]